MTTVNNPHVRIAREGLTPNQSISLAVLTLNHKYPSDVKARDARIRAKLDAIALLDGQGTTPWDGLITLEELRNLWVVAPAEYRSALNRLGLVLADREQGA